MACTFCNVHYTYTVNPYIYIFVMSQKNNEYYIITLCNENLFHQIMNNELFEPRKKKPAILIMLTNWQAIQYMTWNITNSCNWKWSICITTHYREHYMYMYIHVHASQHMYIIHVGVHVLYNERMLIIPLLYSWYIPVIFHYLSFLPPMNYPNISEVWWNSHL